MCYSEQILRTIHGNILRMMKKRKNRKETARATISSVKREMQKPRLTESVRNDGRSQTAPIVDEPPACPERV